MLKGYKTYIVAVLFLVGPLAALVTGDMSVSDFVNDPLVLQGLGIAALRHGIASK